MIRAGIGRWVVAGAVTFSALGIGAGPALADGSAPAPASSAPASSSPTASSSPAASSSAAGPQLGPDRVVLQTTAGDVVLGLYPDVAPKTVAHVLALARSGAFDGTDFFRVVAGFVVQLDANQRTTPLTAAQQALVSQTVPLEVQSGLRHHRGVLSMAHYDGKPGSGGPSFSILLGDAANLDGQYTIFGDVEQGMDVVDEIAAVPVAGSRPVVPIIVEHAVVTDAAGLSAMHVQGPIPIAAAGTAGDIATWPRLLLSTSMGDVLAILSPRDAPKHVQLIEDLVKAGAYTGATLGRADPGSYVQWFPASGSTTSSPLPVESGSVGNVAGALSVDARDPSSTPALTFVLADNHALDSRYTAVGWVTEGSDVLNALAHVATGADHRPRATFTITKATIVPGGSAVVVIRGLSTSGSGTGKDWGAFGLVAAATIVGFGIFLFSKRLTPTLTASLGLLVVLLGFFGLWVGLVPRAGATSQWLGLALFAGAIVLFRLMGRFERGRPLPGPAPALLVPSAVAAADGSAAEPAVARTVPAGASTEPDAGADADGSAAEPSVVG